MNHLCTCRYRTRRRSHFRSQDRAYKDSSLSGKRQTFLKAVNLREDRQRHLMSLQLSAGVTFYLTLHIKQGLDAACLKYFPLNNPHSHPTRLFSQKMIDSANCEQLCHRTRLKPPIRSMLESLPGLPPLGGPGSGPIPRPIMGFKPRSRAPGTKRASDSRSCFFRVKTCAEDTMMSIQSLSLGTYLGMCRAFAHEGRPCTLKSAYLLVSACQFLETHAILRYPLSQAA